MQREIKYNFNHVNGVFFEMLEDGRAAVRPGHHLGAIVSRVDNDGVVGNAQFAQHGHGDVALVRVDDAAGRLQHRLQRPGARLADQHGPAVARHARQRAHDDGL